MFRNMDTKTGGRVIYLRLGQWVAVVALCANLTILRTWRINLTLAKHMRPNNVQPFQPITRSDPAAQVWGL